MFFFARSLRIQILFEPILILSMASVFASSSTASVCEIVSVMSSFLRTVSVSMSEAFGPSCPGLVVTSVESFEPRVHLSSAPLLPSFSRGKVCLCKKRNAAVAAAGFAKSFSTLP